MSSRNDEPAARFAHVTKTFGAVTAVGDVSFTVERGKVFGLIGPNGAGKTTSFSMLAGYLAPTKGEVEILGCAPRDVDALRGRLGVLPQDAVLPQTDRVGELLVHAALLQDIPSAKAEKICRDTIAEVGGSEWWNVRCGALSHGMAKRVALALALLGEPEVVLLDEPTAGLDPKVAYEVRQIVKSRRGRATMIVSSHNLHELEEICDAAAILDRGKLIATGTISELTNASEEIHVRLAPGSPVPMTEVRALEMVARVEHDEEKSEMVVYYDRQKTDAETVIGATLWVLLNQRARISGVSKGRGLEQRVMEMTG